MDKSIRKRFFSFTVLVVLSVLLFYISPCYPGSCCKRVVCPSPSIPPPSPPCNPPFVTCNQDCFNPLIQGCCNEAESQVYFLSMSTCCAEMLFVGPFDECCVANSDNRVYACSHNHICLPVIGGCCQVDNGVYCNDINNVDYCCQLGATCCRGNCCSNNSVCCNGECCEGTSSISGNPECCGGLCCPNGCANDNVAECCAEGFIGCNTQCQFVGEGSNAYCCGQDALCQTGSPACFIEKNCDLCCDDSTFPIGCQFSLDNNLFSRCCKGSTILDCNDSYDEGNCQEPSHTNQGEGC